MRGTKIKNFCSSSLWTCYMYIYIYCIYRHKKKKKNKFKKYTNILNQSIIAGAFPDKLKLAKVIPIHTMRDNTKIDNYRLISILSAISKIFERVLFNQIDEYFSSHNLYNDSQYGFRKKTLYRTCSIRISR